MCAISYKLLIPVEGPCKAEFFHGCKSCLCCTVCASLLVEDRDLPAFLTVQWHTLTAAAGRVSPSRPWRNTKSSSVHRSAAWTCASKGFPCSKGAIMIPFVTLSHTQSKCESDSLVCALCTPVLGIRFIACHKETATKCRHLLTTASSHTYIISAPLASLCTGAWHMISNAVTADSSKAICLTISFITREYSLFLSALGWRGRKRHFLAWLGLCMSSRKFIQWGCRGQDVHVLGRPPGCLRILRGHEAVRGSGLLLSPLVITQCPLALEDCGAWVYECVQLAQCLCKGH